MSTFADETTVGTNPMVEDVLDTPALKLPPTPAEAHQGKIDGVTLDRFESGATAITFAVTSVNVPTVSDTIRLFLPAGFVEDIHVDPSTLPTEEKNNQQQQYAIGVKNTDGTATLQEIRRIAYEQGRTTEGLEKPETIDDFVAALNHLVVGMDVVFTRRPNTKAEDPRFRNRLQGSSILNPNVVNNPKMLKKYVKLWETVTE